MGAFSIIAPVDGSDVSNLTQPLTFSPTDGGFYGVDDALLFRLSKNGVFSRFHSFSQANDLSEGTILNAPLFVGANGTLYGTTQRGGLRGGGTVFRLNSGVVTTQAA
ncbi:MAG: choice-of-anchor tandem repeat GloVer-containing protein, partial [Verrucomicrobiota bacterium]